MTVDELAAHNHVLMVGGYSGWETYTVNGDQLYVPNYINALNSGGIIYTGPVYDDHTYTSGMNAPHNNMEPYKVVYIFMRSA